MEREVSVPTSPTGMTPCTFWKGDFCKWVHAFLFDTNISNIYISYKPNVIINIYVYIYIIYNPRKIIHQTCGLFVYHQIFGCHGFFQKPRFESFNSSQHRWDVAQYLKAYSVLAWISGNCKNEKKKRWIPRPVRWVYITYDGSMGLV